MKDTICKNIIELRFELSNEKQHKILQKIESMADRMEVGLQLRKRIMVRNNLEKGYQKNK